MYVKHKRPFIEIDVNSKKDRRLFGKLYRSYYNEMTCFTNNNDGVPSRQDLFHILRDKNIIKHFICNKDGEYIGFYIINDSERVLTDIYIRPDYRRMGFGCSAIEYISGTYGTVFTSAVDERNIVAIKFFNKVGLL